MCNLFEPITQCKSLVETNVVKGWSALRVYKCEILYQFINGCNYVWAQMSHFALTTQSIRNQCCLKLAQFEAASCQLLQCVIILLTKLIWVMREYLSHSGNIYRALVMVIALTQLLWNSKWFAVKALMNIYDHGHNLQLLCLIALYVVENSWTYLKVEMDLISELNKY